MKTGPNQFEYRIHLYKYGHEKKRKQFRKLLKEGKVKKLNPSGFSLHPYVVYVSETPIKIVRG